jgi:sortase A
MKRRLTRTLAVLLLTLGGWQVGEGAWIHAKAAMAQILIKRAWDQALAGRTAIHPWPWADTFPVARLTVPALDVDEIVLAGASGRTLAFGPGHMDGTAAPGAPGLSVISAHRDTHFRFLSAVKAGQSVILIDPAGIEHVYRVTETRVVDADKTALDATGETPRLALVTCYPFDSPMPGGRKRFVVFAEAQENAGSPPREVAGKSTIAIPVHPPI